MKKILGLIIVSGLLVSTLFAGISSAYVQIDTTLSFDVSPDGQVNSGDEVVVSGKLKPRRCWLGQTVRVYFKGTNPDTVLDSDDLDRHGEYSVTLHPESDLRIYALAEAGFIVKDSGATLKCIGARTRIVRIDVA